MSSATDSKELLNRLAQRLYDKKAENIMAIDVGDVSSFTNVFMIASGNIERHVQSLCREVELLLKEQGEHPDHIEGKDDGSWIVLDCGALVVHLFTPECRDRYRLEELWAEGEIVDLNIVIPTQERG